MLPISLFVVALVAFAECYPEALPLDTKEIQNLCGGLSEETLDLESNVGHIIISHSSPPWPPLSWDWRELGGVIPFIKDQGDCDAGWAFSIIGAIESHRQIHLNIVELLSEQFLIDCIDGSKGTHGCSNKYLPNLQKETYGELIAKFNGVAPNFAYREYSGNKSTCQYPKPGPAPVSVLVSGFRSLYTDFFENEMTNHLLSKGPLVAAINSASMKNYTGAGVDEPSEQDCDPNPSSMDHFVLIVGYGWHIDAERKIPYWIIKNSRGADWGVNGYYYLVRGRNACGIANDISVPFVDDFSYP